ncbi:raffinose/stachyose/melibiose transport system permease protein [Candidatus Planktophila lacus]|jgi:raffinose/stachyose/melibiose transport system permease protein|uniref:carbohydrate ABC transporter permease n=1 Tax=Candidatus Planktophila lacus TaxID=1884913 RepID=UPI000BACDD29|nr:sugar ABC transporter permease [Candidatus Planktophila lacus]ASY24494.1 raffinose/stachyose/melibiose transport system permease protein [Candidatus Planktophila lacus]
MKFAALPLAIFTVVLVVPFVNGFYYTFTDWDGFKVDKFVGFSNYAESFADPKFWTTLRFTGLFVVVSLVLVNVVAFGLALIVTSNLRSRNFLRTLFFVPNLVGGVVLGVIWQFIFNSAIVALANKYDWELFKQSWLQDTNKAFWALIIVTVWQSSGYMMIVYITGLVSIENDVLEASQIDGASPLRTLFAIKIPLMAQAFTIALFLTLRGGFMAYDVNVALTEGGPFRTTELISLHIFQDAFGEGNFGTGQSKAVIMFIVVALAALVQVTISKRYEVQR